MSEDPVPAGLEEAPVAAEGLRERKKRLMRQLISDTATSMFLERGFEEVRVAEVAAACETISAATADDVAFAADDFARVKIVDVAADFDNFTDEFVTDGHGNRDGGGGPFVPFVDVQVGAADAGV